MVVGDAVCPCVRDSMGTSAEPSARPVMASVTCTEERGRLLAGASLAEIHQSTTASSAWRNAAQGLWPARAAANDLAKEMQSVQGMKAW